MKITPLMPLLLWLCCGCAPDTSGHGSTQTVLRAADAPSATVASPAQPALPGGSAVSYEVSIASAEADRVRARDICDSKPKTERPACHAAAEAAYDKAKIEAEDGDTIAP